MDDLLKRTGSGEPRVEVLDDARRLLEIDPEGRWPNQLAAAAYLDEKAYDRAVPFTKTLMRAYPHLTIGFQLGAEAAVGLGASRQALELYQQATERYDAPVRRIYQAMGRLHLQLNQPASAYTLLKESVQVFSPDTPIDRFQDLIDAAVRSAHAKMVEPIRHWLEQRRLMENGAANP